MQSIESIAIFCFSQMNLMDISLVKKENT